MENGIVEVKASHGDTHLGGDDFDQLLIDHVAGLFKEKHAIDLKENLGAVNRLWIAVEKAKRALSDHPFASIREEFIAGEFHLDVEISREEYEAMIRPLLSRTMSAVHSCLRDANFLPKAIDKVILVGGSTRTPLVARMLEDEMGIVPHHEINPDLIVAMGAAVQGAAMGGAKTSSILVDITPYTFGTRVLGKYRGRTIDNLYVPVIRRNTALPTGKEELFATSQDNQQEILVEIFQGDEPLASDNIFIGNFWIKGLSRAKAGNLILLNLELDVNGILKVTAKEKSTGLAKTVTMDTANRGADSNVEEKRLNIESFLKDDAYFDAGGDDADDDGDDDGNDDALDVGNDADDVVLNKDELIGRAKSLRKRAEAMIPDANEEDAAELKNLLEQNRQAIAAHDWSSVDRLNESLADMLFYLED
jgi:molecular chaperone DnaK